MVSSFVHSSSTAAFASGIFIACGIGMNLCTKFLCVIEVNPCPAMRSSWILDCKDSAGCLVDSWDSTFQPYIVLNSFSLPLFCIFPDTWMLLVHLFAWHGWWHRSFQFSSCVFENSWVFSVIWINEVNSSQFPSIVELPFLFCPFLVFSMPSGFTNFRPYFWPLIWSGSRLNLWQSLSGPHVSFWRLLFR